MSMYKVSPDVSPKTQPLSSCCWLTCLEMLFDWKKKDYSGILARMDASPTLFPYYMKNNGISPYDCKETARMLGLKSGMGEIDAEILDNCLKMHGPIWVAGDWVRGDKEAKDPEFINKKSEDNSHVILVTGCDSAAGKIKYVNPYKNFDLSESNGTVSWLNNRSSVWKNTDAGVMYW